MADEVKNETKNETKATKTAPRTVVEPAPVAPEQEATAPVNVGAERATEVAREIAESSGDPIRDAKLMEVHGSLYDPATSKDDTASVDVTADHGLVNRTPDQVIPEATRREMQRGKEVLAGFRGNMVRASQPVPSANVPVPRVNQPQETFKTPGQPVENK